MLKPPKRLVVWIAVLIGLTGALWYGVRWLQLDPVTLVSSEGQPDVALGHVSLTHYDESGHVSWSVQAEHIAFDEGERSTVAQNVVVQFWERSERNSSDNLKALLTVEADRMIFDNLRQDLTFEGPLTAENDTGLRFETTDARWSDREQALTGDAWVRVEQQQSEGGRLFLEGMGFRYDVTAGTIVIQKDSHLQWQPEAAEAP